MPNLPRRNSWVIFAVALLAATMVASSLGAITRAGSSGAPSMETHGSGGSTAATPQVIPQECVPVCGPKNGIVSIDFQVYGVPAFYNGVYPIYVAINIAYTEDGTTLSDFQQVPVQGGLVVDEPNGPTGFIGSYNTQECDLLNPDEGCYWNQSAVDASGNPYYFAHAGFPYDSPYYSKVPSQFSYVVDCSGFPFGKIYVGGSGDVNISVTLDYEDCQGYNYGYTGGSGDGDLNDSNNSTGPWDFVPAEYENLSEMNITLDENDSVISGSGGSCSVCTAVSSTTFPLSANNTLPLSGGGVGLNVALGLPVGTYRWTSNLPGFATVPASGTWDITAGTTAEAHGAVERTYPVTFSTTNIATDTPFLLTISGLGTELTERSNAPSVTVYLPNGTYSYNASSVDLTFKTDDRGPFTVSAVAPPQPLPFHGPAVFNATIGSQGLPAGTPFELNWSSATAPSGSVRGVSGASGALATVQLTNGSYQLSANVGSWYASSSSSNSLDLSGAPAGKTIAFSSVPTALLELKETGLPFGSPWGISLGEPALNVSTYGSTVSVPITEAVYNSTFTQGVYAIDKFVDHDTGYDVAKVVIPKGGLSFGPAIAPVADVGVATPTKTIVVSCTFAPIAPLTISVVGLPAGAFWIAYVNSTTGGPMVAPQGTTAGSLVFHLPATSVKYSVTVPSAYAPKPGHGTLTVSPAGTTKVVRVQAFTGKLIFVVQGLPKGTEWGVNLTGTAAVDQSTTGSQLTFALTNGSYNWTAWATGGTSLAPSSGHTTLQWTLTIRVQRIEMT